MNTYIFIIVWILSTYPITKRVNDRLEEKDDDARFLVSFQILLFLRALFHVPTFYFGYWVNLIKKLLK